jgi:hypothetical protein
VVDIDGEEGFQCLHEQPFAQTPMVLYDAVDALEEARNEHEGGICPYRAVLVTSKSGRVTGKLSLLDLLRSLEPKYGEMGDLREVMGSGFHAEFLRSTIAAYDLWETPLDELGRKKKVLTKSRSLFP